MHKMPSLNNIHQVSAWNAFKVLFKILDQRIFHFEADPLVITTILKHKSKMPDSKASYLVILFAFWHKAKVFWSIFFASSQLGFYRFYLQCISSGIFYLIFKCLRIMLFAAPALWIHLQAYDLVYFWPLKSWRLTISTSICEVASSWGMHQQWSDLCAELCGLDIHAWTLWILTSSNCVHIA